MTDKGIWNSHTLGTAPRRESVEEYFDWKLEKREQQRESDRKPQKP